MHKKVENAFEEIDAALFSGDTFLDKIERGNFSMMLGRWGIGIACIESNEATRAAENAPPPTDLQRVVKLAELLEAQSIIVKKLDDDAKAAKKRLLEIEREDLPLLMEELGMKSLTLESGAEIKVVHDCSTSITAKTKPRALAWLIQNGFGGLIKTNVMVAFGRGEHDEAIVCRNHLANQYEAAELSEAVHPATLKSFVKEQMAAGAPIPMDLFNVNPYSKAVVK